MKTNLKTNIDLERIEKKMDDCFVGIRKLLNKIASVEIEYKDTKLKDLKNEKDRKIYKLEQRLKKFRQKEVDERLHRLEIYDQVYEYVAEANLAKEKEKA